MWKTYKYIYYWLYTWNKKLWGENDIPQFNAVVGMSLSFLGILFSFISLIYIITDIQLLPSDISKSKLVVPLLSVLGIHYFAFMHNGKYYKIEKEFKK